MYDKHLILGAASVYFYATQRKSFTVTKVTEAFCRLPPFFCGQLLAVTGGFLPTKMAANKMRLLPITAIYRIVMKTLGKKKNGEKVGKKKKEKNTVRRNS